MTCKTLRNNEKKRLKECKKDIAKEACRVTCGTCCRDDPDFSFKYEQNVGKSCEWLATQKKNKIDKICNDDDVGGSVSYHCIETCDACYSEVV